MTTNTQGRIRPSTGNEVTAGTFTQTLASHPLDRFRYRRLCLFVDSQRGLLARTTGRGIGLTGDEIVMISVWESLDVLKNMTGDEWESAVIPDQREVNRIAEHSVHHFQSAG